MRTSSRGCSFSIPRTGRSQGNRLSLPIGIRATPHSATQCTPAELLFNQNIATAVPFFKEGKQDTELYREKCAYKPAMDMYCDAQRPQRR